MLVDTNPLWVILRPACQPLVRRPRNAGDTCKPTGFKISKKNGLAA